ncbi:MAG: hypothetical protein JPMHGGIA_02692 [Saprospiraceae bacterium]|jgi:ABC-type glycerol-3-phosphate transport system permease component|nr:hypothetical protein [Saprospiraceae bacterium]
MDLGTTIVGIVIILICIIPFALMSINSRKKEKKLIQGLSDIANRNNCKISRHELWNNSIIGIDDTVLMIFFTRKSKDNETSQQINLTEIQKCRVINSSRTVSNKEGNFKVVEKLELAFSFQDKSKSEVVLEFYNADYDSLTLMGELQLVEKWCKIFNDKISEMTKQKK